MRVDLGGRDVAVAEHLLQHAQVGPALEHVGGKAVAQQVGVQAGQAHLAAVLFHQAHHRAARDLAAAGVEEDSMGVLGAAGLGAAQVGAAVHEVVLQAAQGAAHERHHALLAALALHADQAVVEQQARKAQAGELAHAQAAAVEHLEHGVVAQARGREREGLVEQAAHLRHREGLWQALGALGQRHAADGVGVCDALAHAKAVEALGCGHVAVGAAGGIAALDEVAQVVGDVAALQLPKGVQPAGVQKAQVVGEVAAVGVDGGLREAPLDRQVDEEVIEEGAVGSGVCVLAGLELAGHGGPTPPPRARWPRRCGRCPPGRAP